LYKGQEISNIALRYVSYSPTIKEIDSVLVKLGQIERGYNKQYHNYIEMRNIEMDDYISIALSFIFRIINNTKYSENNRNMPLFYDNNLKPFGEKGSEKYQQVLIEVVSDYFRCNKLKHI